ncbi:MAG: DUF120 domain-containing protein [Candidatus Moranbacteria bacterium]|nr:DUF120 domain-containing protein [Candidatus Moranbacteria bacterium]
MKVICSGTFNFIHLGHVFFLKTARNLGDSLTIILTHDKNNLKKNALNIQKRIQNLKNLKIKAEIVEGEKDNYQKLLNKINPDLICLGYDQTLPPQLQNFVEKKQIKIKQLPKLKNYKKAKNKILGRIFSAKGRGAFFLKKPGYQKRLKKLLKKEIFPGTLNVSLCKQNISELLKNKEKLSVVSFEQYGKIYGGLKIYKVKLLIYKDLLKPDSRFIIKQKTNLKAWLVSAEKSSHQPNIVEIIHPKNLRKTHNLKDDQLVEIVF